MPAKLEASSISREKLPAIPPAWVRFLRAHAAITARMDATLRERHDLSLREYEVLLALDEAPGRRLRRVDLAATVLLTQSGVTRLLAPLEKRGHVASVRSSEDRRVTYAQLTAGGRRLFRQAARTHRGDIQALFAGQYTQKELAHLDTLLERLPGAAGGSAWREG
jgi:DNA-binding MarR family transcriptional regulator